MKAYITVKKVGDLEDLTKKGLRFLKHNSVYVGIPDDTTQRKRIPGEDDSVERITNAELLFIHTNGSPINHIPKRPVIEPAIENDKDRLNSMLKKAGKMAMDGRKAEAINQLSRVGLRAQNDARKWFVDPANRWPPNSPAVQAYKRAKGSTDPKPLIDTAELRKSITYFVDLRGRRIK